MFAVMRRACFMEDEGRECLMFTCGTRERAEQYIHETIERSKGYFTRPDFYIMGKCE